MARGGARVRSGPDPDPDALRRDRPSDKATWTHLPTAGRSGAAPDWPLPTRPTASGRRMWTALWARPEAVMWEAHGAAIQVALYVLAVLAAEGPAAKSSDRLAALRYMDDLGLSEGGRRANRWVIDDAGSTRQQETGPAAKGRSSARDRLKLVVG